MTRFREQALPNYRMGGIETGRSLLPTTIARDRPSRYGPGTEALVGSNDREGQALALRARGGLSYWTFSTTIT